MILKIPNSLVIDAVTKKHRTVECYNVLYLKLEEDLEHYLYRKNIRVWTTNKSVVRVDLEDPTNLQEKYSNPYRVTYSIDCADTPFSQDMFKTFINEFKTRPAIDPILDTLFITCDLEDAVYLRTAFTLQTVK